MKIACKSLMKVVMPLICACMCHLPSIAQDKDSENQPTVDETVAYLGKQFPSVSIVEEGPNGPRTITSAFTLQNDDEVRFWEGSSTHAIVRGFSLSDIISITKESSCVVITCKDDLSVTVWPFSTAEGFGELESSSATRLRTQSRECAEKAAKALIYLMRKTGNSSSYDDAQQSNQEERDKEAQVDVYFSKNVKDRTPSASNQHK